MGEEEHKEDEKLGSERKYHSEGEDEDKMEVTEKYADVKQGVDEIDDEEEDDEKDSNNVGEVINDKTQIEGTEEEDGGENKDEEDSSAPKGDEAEEKELKEQIKQETKSVDADLAVDESNEEIPQKQNTDNTDNVSEDEFLRGNLVDVPSLEELSAEADKESSTTEVDKTSSEIPAQPVPDESKEIFSSAISEEEEKNKVAEEKEEQVTKGKGSQGK